MGKIKILALLIIITTYSQCIAPRYLEAGHYEIIESRCPVYPSVKHKRAVGKQFNPEHCNFVH